MKTFYDFMGCYLPTIEFELLDNYPFSKQGNLGVKYMSDFIIFKKNGEEICIEMHTFSELIRCINAIDPEYIDYVLKEKV